MTLGKFIPTFIGVPVDRIRTIVNGVFNPSYISGLLQWHFNQDNTVAENIQTLEEGSYLIDSSTTGTQRPIQQGRCYNFDGVDDYIDIPAFVIDHTQDFEISWYMDSDGDGMVLGSSTSNTPYIWLTSADVRLRTQDTTIYIFTGLGRSNYTAAKYVLSKVGTNITLSLYDFGGNLLDSVTLTWTTTSGTTTFSRISGRISDYRIPAKIFGMNLNNQAFYKCDEQDGIIAYDSSGNGYHGIITNATLSSFHDTQDVISYQNNVGYSENRISIIELAEQDFTLWYDTNSTDFTSDYVVLESNQYIFDLFSFDSNKNYACVLQGTGDFKYRFDTGVITNGTFGEEIVFSGSGKNRIQLYGRLNGCTITGVSLKEFLPSTVKVPRDESNPTLDVMGEPLEYSGRVPYNAKLIESHCVDFDGVDDYIDIPAFVIDHTQDFEISWYMDSDGDGMVLGSSTSNTPYIWLTSADVRLRLQNVNIYIFTGLGRSNYTAAKYVLSKVGTNITLSLYDFGGNLLDSVTLTWTTTSGTTTFSRISGRISDYRIPAKIFGMNLNNEAYYPLSEGNGTVIYDVSGNGNHGTAVNTNTISFWGDTQDAFHYNMKQGFRRNTPGTNLIDTVITASNFTTYGSNTVVDSADNFVMFTYVNNRDIGYLPMRDSTVLSQNLDPTKTYKLSFEGYVISNTTVDVQVRATTTVPFVTLSSTKRKYEILCTPSTNRITFFIRTAFDITNADVYIKILDLVEYSEVKIPALLDGSAAADGNSITNTAGNFHNNAETQIDFSGGVLSPIAVQQVWKTLYFFGYGRTNPEFVDDSETLEEKNYLAYEDEVTGEDLTNLNDYLNK